MEEFMTRGKVREQLFCLLFSLEFYPVELWDEEMEMYFGAQEKLSDSVRNQLISQVRDIADHLPQLNQIIREQAKDWTLERIAITDRVALRLAFYEILYVEEVPAAVSMNEAVELVKKYGTEKSSSFVNGILGAWYRVHSCELSENEEAKQEDSKKVGAKEVSDPE
jgi:N utilization substance protein B